MFNIFSIFKDKPFKCFIGEYGDLKTKSRSYKGVKAIPVDKIVGTVGRCHKDSRWREIKRSHHYLEIKYAMKNLEPMPAIEVYKVDDEYYIVDGHHRVMASRDIGRKYIDAEVEEIVFSDEKKDVEDRPCPMDYDHCPMKDFENKTGLKGILLDSREQYQNLLDYIKSLGSDLTLKELSWSWYKNNFLPFVEDDETDEEDEKTESEKYYNENVDK